MYLKFINKDKDLPESWQSYFEGMSEDLSINLKSLKSCILNAAFFISKK